MSNFTPIQFQQVNGNYFPSPQDSGGSSSSRYAVGNTQPTARDNFNKVTMMERINAGAHSSIGYSSIIYEQPLTTNPPSAPPKRPKLSLEEKNIRNKERVKKSRRKKLKELRAENAQLKSDLDREKKITDRLEGREERQDQVQKPRKKGLKNLKIENEELKIALRKQEKINDDLRKNWKPSLQVNNVNPSYSSKVFFLSK